MPVYGIFRGSPVTYFNERWKKIDTEMLEESVHYNKSHTDAPITIVVSIPMLRDDCSAESASPLREAVVKTCANWMSVSL